MLTVPEESVVSFAGVNKVFRVEADKVKQVEVKLGQRLTVSNSKDFFASLTTSFKSVSSIESKGSPG